MENTNNKEKIVWKRHKIITKNKEKYIVVEHEGKNYEVLKKDVDLVRGIYFTCFKK
jgi:hypothetical protein